jgi:hypothetical protein
MSNFPDTMLTYVIACHYAAGQDPNNRVATCFVLKVIAVILHIVNSSKGWEL